MLWGRSQYGTVKQKMQDFSTRECGAQAPDRDLLRLNRTVLGSISFCKSGSIELQERLNVSETV
jgi:hypothetical protein